MKRALWVIVCAAALAGPPAAPAAATPAHPVTHPHVLVALGDSVAAGEDLHDSYPADNPCHRAPEAYPGVLRADRTIDPSGRLRSAACTGATAANVLRRPQLVNGRVVAPQLDQIRAAVDGGVRITTATVTVGANDLGWIHVVGTCLGGGRTLCEALHAGRQIPAVARRVGRIAAELRALGARRVLATGYFNPFPARGLSASQAGRCPGLSIVLASGSPLDRYADGTMALLNRWRRALNRAVRRAVVAEGASYVNITPAIPANHRLCARRSWIVSPSLSVEAGRIHVSGFHPTARGQRSIAATIARTRSA